MGSGVIYDRKTTPDFDFGLLESSKKPCVYFTLISNKFSLHYAMCNRPAFAICLIPSVTTTTTTKETNKTTVTTTKAIDSNFTITQQTSNETKKENVFKKIIFPVVLAYVAGVTLLSGFLSFACCGRKTKNYLSYPQTQYPGYYKPGYFLPGCAIL